MSNHVKLECVVCGEGAVYTVEIARDAKVSALKAPLVETTAWANHGKVPSSEWTLYLVRNQQGEWLKDDADVRRKLKEDVDMGYDTVLCSSSALNDPGLLGDKFDPQGNEIHVLVALPARAPPKGPVVGEKTKLAVISAKFPTPSSFGRITGITGWRRTLTKHKEIECHCPVTSSDHAPTLPIILYYEAKCLQTLSTTAMMSLCRACASLKLAMKELTEYYSPTGPTRSLAQSRFPYKDTAVIDGLLVHLEYKEPIVHDVFLARLKGSHREVVVKFAKRYGREVHDFSEGFAPRILDYQVLVNGWVFIVMEKLQLAPVITLPREMKAQVVESVGAIQQRLASAAYVHGDLRENNLL